MFQSRLLVSARDTNSGQHKQKGTVCMVLSSYGCCSLDVQSHVSHWSHCAYWQRCSLATQTRTTSAVGTWRQLSGIAYVPGSPHVFVSLVLWSRSRTGTADDGASVTCLQQGRLVKSVCSFHREEVDLCFHPDQRCSPREWEFRCWLATKYVHYACLKDY